MRSKIKIGDHRPILVLALWLILSVLAGVAPARALTTAEPAGLGTLVLEVEGSRQFFDPRVNSWLGRFSYGLSQQIDVRLTLGQHARDNYSGFIFGGGLKYLVEMETEYFPCLGLVLEAQRANFGVIYTSSFGLNRSGWEEVFNFSGCLIASKRWGSFNPYLAVGVNSFDLNLVDVSSNQPVAGKSGHSLGIFGSVGLSYELARSISILFQADYDSAGPLGAHGLTGRAGLNVII